MGKFERKQKKTPVWLIILTFLLSIPSGYFMARFLNWGLYNMGVPGEKTQSESADYAMMDRYDMYMTNAISSALEGVFAIDKVYWLDDADMVAPEPNPDNFGTATTASEMQWFLDASADILNGQETVFNTDIELKPGSKITYYLDETIMNITWQQVFHNGVYTISEVKITHPSQFRRFLADGEYGSDKQYHTTQMAQTVNAVTASSGDFYKFRSYGITVYEGEVHRVESSLDICFINDQGELLFVPRGEMTDKAQVEQFVEENNVRFSLAFGPVLIDNYEVVAPSSYPVGEITDNYSRAALCYLGDLHYLLVTANQETGYGGVPTMAKFAETLSTFGCEKAYALDGGQTAVIVTNDQLQNRPDWGRQRLISDIIYFATAVPEGG